jgi:hypothetical protein
MSNRKPTAKRPKPVWAYAYVIEPPQAQERLHVIKALLDTERATARLGKRTWEARFVTEKQVTHILVVSDTPHQDLEHNQRLEAALRDLQAEFSVSAPMAVEDEPVSPPL